MTPQRVRVRVPATSANLGPGFDALGLALGVYDELEVARTDAGLHVTPYGNVPLDERNLVVRALRAAFAATGGQPAGLALTYTPRVPHSRGLGSSAAAICAGVVAALALRGEPIEAGGLALQLAAGLEGHPDNVAACLFGGATIAWYDAPAATRGSESARGQQEHPDAPLPRAMRLEPAEGLTPVVFVPQVRTSTEAARSALPQQVPHRDAAYNAGRAALLVAALAGRPDLLFSATEDRLHQAFRLPAVPVSARLVGRLREAGIPAVLSGSGPTVLALCRSRDEAEAAVALAPEPSDTGAQSALDVLTPGLDRHGCVLIDA